MEWVEGARLSDRAMLDTYGLEPSRLVDTMVRTFADSLSPRFIVLFSFLEIFLVMSCNLGGFFYNFFRYCNENEQQSTYQIYFTLNVSTTQFLLKIN